MKAGVAVPIPMFPAAPMNILSLNASKVDGSSSERIYKPIGVPGVTWTPAVAGK